MTYLDIENATFQNYESVTMLHNSSTDYNASNGYKLALDASLSLHGSESYSVSSGVVTLPSGSYYLLRGMPAAYYPNADSSMNSASLEYQFYDEGASAYIGRRGFLGWQEAGYYHLTWGDEVALALVDASSSSKTFSLPLVTVNDNGNQIVVDPSSSTYTYYYYNGYSRVEIWRFNA